MNSKTIIRRTLDAVMTVISVFLMGGVFLFPSDIVHEILGTVLIVLWILHNILNRTFYKSLFKGKYSTTRIMMAAVNAALAVSCVLLAISGIMLSNRVFLFLRIERGMGFARKAHLAASHWYFILIAFHFAQHTAILFGRITVRGGRLIAMRCVVCAASLYGVVAFVRLGLWKYLFLTQEFFFFDMQRGFALFLLDYICMFVLFASVIKIAALFAKNAKSSESERLQKS